MSSTSLLIVGIFVVVGLVVAIISIRGATSRRSPPQLSETILPPTQERVRPSLSARPVTTISNTPQTGRNGSLTLGNRRANEVVRRSAEGMTDGSPNDSILPSSSPSARVTITPIVIRSSLPYTPPPDTSQQTQTIDVEIPLDWGDEVICPSTWIKFNQKVCVLCRRSIYKSYTNTGWARCEQTGKLVHKHCYDGARENSSTWCAICGGNCRKGVPMTILAHNGA